MSIRPHRDAESEPAPLIVFSEHLPRARGDVASDRLVLPFERRQKTRQRLRLGSGREIGVHVPRGTVLRGGDRLRGPDGTVVEVVAAPERVSTVRSRNLRELACVAYHLGNRHVALEVGDGWVRYLADHVLDALVEQLGLAVLADVQPFEPEAGAYGGGHGHGLDATAHAYPGTHPHGHAHAHEHEHEHEHEHGDSHAHAHEPAGDAPRYVLGPAHETIR